jgi:hypothetical protein
VQTSLAHGGDSICPHWALLVIFVKIAMKVTYLSDFLSLKSFDSKTFV